MSFIYCVAVGPQGKPGLTMFKLLEAYTATQTPIVSILICMILFGVCVASLFFSKSFWNLPEVVIFVTLSIL